MYDDDLPGGAAQSRRWRDAFTWAGCLAVSWILYELTHQLAFGTAMLCLKFGWEDFLTAQWLYRVDLWRPRGRACWWMHISAGLWKATGTAFLANVGVIIGLTYLGPQSWQAPGPGLNRLELASLVSVLTTLIGLGLAGATAVVAILIASMNGVKLWLDRSASTARRAREWPPLGPTNRRANWLAWLLATSWYAVAVLVAGLVVVCVTFMDIGEPGILLAGVFSILTIFVPALAAWQAYRRVGALAASDCWPLNEAVTSPHDPLQWQDTESPR